MWLRGSFHYLIVMKKVYLAFRISLTALSLDASRADG